MAKFPTYSWLLDGNYGTQSKQLDILAKIYKGQTLTILVGHMVEMLQVGYRNKKIFLISSSFQLCYINHPIVVVCGICVIVDRC